jgi:hypothetical protein
LQLYGKPNSTRDGKRVEFLGYDAGMRAHRRTLAELIPFVIAAVWITGCGPSYGGQDAKTQDEVLAEQERLGEEQLKKQEQHEYTGPVEETDMERKKPWDKKQAELELKRATRGAETCPGSVPEKAPPGTTTVNLTFGNDGHVKSSSIPPPYDGTPVGACVLRALGSVIVPAFSGNEETVVWEVDLTGKNLPEEKDDKTKGKEKEKKK